jgi:hypothetical protein
LSVLLLLAYDLVAANTDERLATESVLYRVTGCDILVDKGFLGEDWQTTIAEETSHCVLTPKRANQAVQNAPALDAVLNALCEQVEGFSPIAKSGTSS